MLLKVETNPDLITTGTIKDPVGKKRPDYLRPWHGFLAQQKHTLYRLFQAYPLSSHHQAFNSRIGMETISNDTLIILTSEKDLEFVTRPLVVTPVSRIIDHLASIPTVCHEFNLNCSIHFASHLNALSNSDPETSTPSSTPASTPTTMPVTTIPEQPKTPPKRKTTPPKKKTRGQPDIVLFYSTANTTPTRKLILHIELKPPHKLSLDDLNQGFRSMNLQPDIIDLNKIPTEETAKGRYQSGRRVASVVTQVFSYLLEGGIEYGIISTGEAFAFLHINLQDPHTVYYYLANPNLEVEEKKGLGQFYLHRTAVSQVLAFTLIALESSQQKHFTNQARTLKAPKKLKSWPSGPTTPASPENSSTQTSPDTSTPYKAPSKKVKPLTSTPPSGNLRSKKAATRNTCRPFKADPDVDDREESPEPPDNNPPTPDSPFVINESLEIRIADSTVSSKEPSSRSTANKRQQREESLPYCTLACLLSLSNSSALDPYCPNYLLHSTHQPITPNTFLLLLRSQLEHTRDQHIYPLGIQGATGVLFKVVLDRWGYVLMGKGTVPTLREDLLHELRVYNHIKSLQGVYVPVCLGLVDLVHPYFYDIGVQIRHVLLLSYGGEPLPPRIVKSISPGNQWWKNSDVKWAVDAVRACGIDHQDIRVPNLLWDNNKQRVMLIDFERSVVIEGLEADIVKKSPGSRKRKWEWKGVD